MAELLKDVYNVSFVNHFSSQVKQHYSSFKMSEFVSTVLDDSWEFLTLKQRMRKISSTLGLFLPSKYDEAINILLKVNEHSVGFPYIILPDFVEVYGQTDDNWDLSIHALEAFTAHSTSEFAVRPFIMRNPSKMMKQMKKWAISDNEHVRRLASEGCRPSLPWAQALTMFKQDPTPIIPILNSLKEDSSLYVRKSVANNINDIAKVQPQLVINLAQSWYGQHDYTNWIIRHGCRTLIKQANPQILNLFGYGNMKDGSVHISDANIHVYPKQVNIGHKSELSYQVTVASDGDSKIRIEYGIYFVKASGNSSLKKFLLSDKTIKGEVKLIGSRSHNWADLTTRKHYAGEHSVVLFVNGQEVAETKVILQPFSAATP